MSGQRSSFDASHSALGYLYQCRLALVLALRRDNDPSLGISIEKLDDIAFQQGDEPTDLLQTKHHVRRTGNLSDGSEDIWKTIRVWSEGIAGKRIDPGKAVFCLVTTSEAGAKNAIRLIRTDQFRDPAAAQAALEASAAKSKSAVIQGAYGHYMSLPQQDRDRLFQSMYLLDRTPVAADLMPQIVREIRLAAEPKHHTALVERLEGWWFEQVIRHLSAAGNEPIPVLNVLDRVVKIAQQFREDNLPDDFLKAPVPDTALPDDDDRLFIRQLRMIGISERRLRMAQEDYYKAAAQRSRWIKDNLVDLDELPGFEKRLKDGWEPLFEIMVEGLAVGCAEAELAQCGVELYNWSQATAPHLSGLWVRPQFQAGYMTKGSFHMLADDPPRLGWHPHYAQRLASPHPTTGETCA